MGEVSWGPPVCPSTFAAGLLGRIVPLIETIVVFERALSRTRSGAPIRDVPGLTAEHRFAGPDLIY